MLTRDRLRKPRRDDGITLTELLVAMGIATILGAMAVAFFVGANRSGQVTVATNQGVGDARVALDNWTSLIRVAGWLEPTPSALNDRFEEITPTKVVFWAYLEGKLPPDPPSKVALMLTGQADGTGRLVQIVFKQGDPTTPASVRQVGLDVEQTDGAWVFTPHNLDGGLVDTSQPQCIDGATVVPGLCAKAPDGAGMLDPTVGATGLSVHAGPLSGDGSADATLNQIGRIDIAFTAEDPAALASMDYASSASVNSGFPSS
ncbi:MAG TPA: prepilin-type N-terminal cleavage/methylation domain-containing protein [Jatrophihabitans sp.]|jgi:Tfp pilus assembly protein PilW|nr:prepilin-type N-terminal cleavage/methylation domain-containing protein [Jatrophihabitans sp.]